MRRSLVLIPFILLLFVTPSLAADRYYDNTNGNDANPCSEAQPCKTMNKLSSDMSNASCGDHFFLKRGETWTENVSVIITDKNCSSSNPIVVDAYGAGARPHLRPSATTSNARVFRIMGGQHIHIRGIRLTNWFAVQNRGASNTVWSDLEVSHGWKEGVNVLKRVETSSGNNSNNVLIENSHIHTTQQGGNNGECIYVGTDPSKLGGSAQDTSSVIIRGNVIGPNCRSDGIEIKPGASGLIERNIVEGNPLPTAHFAGAIIAQPSQNPNANPSIIRYNIVRNNTVGAAIQLRSPGMVYGNIVYGNSHDGIRVNNPFGDSASRLSTQNTVYNNGLACHVVSGGATQKNDICWANKSGNDAQDPLFVNAPAGDFALQANSPAIDTGTNCEFPFNGASCDRGAHETITIAACSVEEDDASTLRIFFEANRFPRLGGISTAGFSYRINSGSATYPSNATLQVSNELRLTLRAPVTEGQTIDFSYSTSGSIRDSAFIGGTNNQRLNGISNRVCTNKVTGDAATPAAPARPSDIRIQLP